jgi:hypothetical protein
VLSRILQFLDDAQTLPATRGLPTSTTPAWAAEQAMAVLDEHFKAGTEAPGLVRFLTNWLKLPVKAGVDVAAAHTWALRLVDPAATLSTLLADPTGQPHRLGILTDPQVLAARSTITTRGEWIEENLFCTSVPAPPPNLPAEPPATTTMTDRQRLEASLSSPSCTGCHRLTDPTGDALEHFDQAGNYRTTDSGMPVDSAASIDQPMQLSFQSFDDLAPALATACPVAQCFSKAVVSDAFGTSSLSFSDDDVNHVANAFADQGFSIRALVTAIVETPAFLR